MTKDKKQELAEALTSDDNMVDYLVKAPKFSWDYEIHESTYNPQLYSFAVIIHGDGIPDTLYWFKAPFVSRRHAERFYIELNVIHDDLEERGVINE